MQTEFKQWMMNTEKMAPGTANGYVSNLNTIRKILASKKNYSINFFSCGLSELDKVEKALELIDEILENKDFSGIGNPTLLGIYKASISKYIKFLKENPASKDTSHISILTKKITPTTINRLIDKSLLANLFEVNYEYLLHGYKKSSEIKQDFLGAKYFENASEGIFLVVVLENKQVSMDTYECMIKALSNAKQVVKNKNVKGMIIAGDSNKTLPNQLKVIYNSELIEQIALKVFKININLEDAK